MRTLFAIASLLVAACAQAAEVRPLADGVWLLPGTFDADRQPDGNSVVFRGRTGASVMDTGRHAAHRAAILRVARDQHLPVVAIVNSHWHLDHTSGNEGIKQAFPALRVHASRAIDRVITDVWPKSTAELQSYVNGSKLLPAGLIEDLQSDIHAQSHPDAMRPDEPVTASGAREIDGRKLEVHLATNAVTDGDVWLFDPRTRIAAVGDLVTLPVPFLDTACAEGWRAALKDIDASGFVMVVPGHGEPMNRATFTAYRSAFENYTTCAATDTDKSVCASQWLTATATMRKRGADDDARADRMAQAYVDMLRRGGGKAPLCRA